MVDNVICNILLASNQDSSINFKNVKNMYAQNIVGILALAILVLALFHTQYQLLSVANCGHLLYNYLFCVKPVFSTPWFNFQGSCRQVH